MANKVDNKVNLETIVKNGKGFMINQEAEKESNPAKQLYFWTEKYLVPKYGAEQAESMNELSYEKKPYRVLKHIKKHKQIHGRSLIAEVSKNPISVAKRLSEGEAQGMAMSRIGDAKYKTLKQAVEREEGVREALAMKYDNQDWASFVMRTDQESVVNYAKKEIGRMTKEAIVDAMYVVNQEKGSIQYSPDKFANIIKSDINRMSPEGKNAIYEEIGLAYTRTAMATQTKKQ